jgi:secondary thiamine-phosphate synthase enzyme
MKTLTVKTHRRTELVDISGDIRAIVRESRVSSGICVVYVPHTTAGVTVNENADPDVREDISSWLDRLVPRNQGFLHSEGNSDSHIKSSLVGCMKTFIVEGGELRLGTWQGIYFCEFDGPRNRQLFVQVQGGG